MKYIAAALALSAGAAVADEPTELSDLITPLDGRQFTAQGVFDHGVYGRDSYLRVPDVGYFQVQTGVTLADVERLEKCRDGCAVSTSGQIRMQSGNIVLFVSQVEFLD